MFKGALAQTHLYALTDTEMARTGLSLRFDAELENHYQNSINALRNKQFVLVALISLLIFEAICVGIVAKGEVVPQRVGAFLWASHLLVVFPTLMATALLHFFPQKKFRREFLFAVLCLLVSLVPAVNHNYLADNGAIGIYFGQVLAIITFNIAFPMTFKCKAITSGLATLIMSLSAILFLDASWHTVSSIIETYFSAMVFSLVASYRIEKSERNSYLLMLRESIRNLVIQRQAEELALLSQTDPLTELPNRRAFDIRLDSEIQKAEDDGAPISVLMIDIDHFKNYNDYYGHPAGDGCLKLVAKAIMEACETGFAARIGGEEFAVILAGLDNRQAEAVADRICGAIQARGITHEKSSTANVVTASIGVATQTASEAMDAKSLLIQADTALYFSKSNGRNMVNSRQNAA
jgi:diguanylate cyclase (GGDEF)-like protein